MITIDTIDKMIQYRHWLSVHCNARDCYNSAAVDLDALAERIGGDHRCRADFLKPYFVCSKCGSRDIGFTTGLEMSNGFGGAYADGSAPKAADWPEPRRRRRARRRRVRI